MSASSSSASSVDADASAPPAQVITRLLKRSVLVSRVAEQMRCEALMGSELVRGSSSGRLGRPFTWVFDTLARWRQSDSEAAPSAWFFGFDESVTGEQRDAMSRRTIGKLRVDWDEVNADAERIVAAMQAGNAQEAQRCTIEAIVRRLAPGVRVDDELCAHANTVRLQMMPSWRWLSPVHWRRSRLAKIAIAQHFDATDYAEYSHHVMAAAGLYTEVLALVNTARFAELLKREAGPDGKRPVSALLAFRRTVPEVIRVTTCATTLGGVLAEPVPAGTPVYYAIARATTRDTRLLACCGQQLITALTAAVIRRFYPQYVIDTARVGATRWPVPNAALFDSLEPK